MTEKLICTMRKSAAWMIWKIHRVALCLRGWWVCLYIRLMGGQCGGALLVGRGFQFKYAPHKGVTLGPDIFLGEQGVVDVPLGGALCVGAGTSFTRGIMLCAQECIVIGKNVLVGEYVSIRDADHGISAGTHIRDQSMVSKPIYIGNDVWIGRGVVVLKGSRIGDGAVIGANAVVNGDIVESGIAVGIPAQVIKYRSTSK